MLVMSSFGAPYTYTFTCRYVECVQLAEFLRVRWIVGLLSLLASNGFSLTALIDFLVGKIEIRSEPPAGFKETARTRRKRRESKLTVPDSLLEVRCGNLRYAFLGIVRGVWFLTI
mmetsp:Transcript_18356/g.30462  ORF Transcript_18356/g.30462 Transcript_18356/m.30462 type:complete len:115 (+) Transcript_18356:466-810(+)